ncbi:MULTISPECIES: DUF7263 family protein [Halolamina]|uniref:Uncharacterized protein n=1 Tax=Halolamina pelagica TaxID=699431 RepID=A0A1I5PV92_9EURY|nr:MULTISPECIES: hypothetical protein [Halolamina]NHX34957.1 hypothetical protein [Halolamina sp. R1-12]SFP37740.1 hypothetical protein SAMN05216277_103113 [Halolamina pelagica]
MNGTRAQANLLSLAVALTALVSAATLGLVVADGALAGADRDPGDRRVAGVAAERLVSAEATTVRENVLDGEAVAELSPAALDSLAPPTANRSVRVQLGGETLVERGDPTGATVERVVLVAERTTRSRSVAVDNGDDLTLPRRTDRVELTFAAGSTVETVRVNGRIVLHDPGGLAGQFVVEPSRDETTTLGFEGGTAQVGIESTPLRTEKATLRVTVDD